MTTTFELEDDEGTRLHVTPSRSGKTVMISLFARDGTTAQLSLSRDQATELAAYLSREQP